MMNTQNVTTTEDKIEGAIGHGCLAIASGLAAVSKSIMLLAVIQLAGGKEPGAEHVKKARDLLALFGS